MQIRQQHDSVFVAAMLVAGLGIAAPTFADDHFHGTISSHSINGALVVLTEDSSPIVVVLDDATRVRRFDGVRSIKVSSAELVPGLRVDVKGAYNIGNRFEAARITFTKHDQRLAKTIAGGITSIDQRSLANQQRLDQHAQALAGHQQSIERQGERLTAHDSAINENHDEIVATTGALEQTNARIANLDDYSVISTTTVYFENGKASIAPKYKAPLEQLAAQAKATNGAIVQVQGYASAAGPAALNQELSQMRSDAVTAILQQNGIAPTNVAVPAAMGTTGQIASNKTAKGQAENRRAVITLLQNKGIVQKR
jgi:outer membrane protein OmpA-like peptidoglycan-associated protein